MKKITIKPDKFRQYGSVESDCSFILITDPDLIEIFEIDQNNSYNRVEVISYSGSSPSQFAKVITEIKRPAHILVICPKSSMISIDREHLGEIKLALMTTSSSPTPVAAIEHFLKQIENTNPLPQRKFADNFFDKIGASHQIHLIDEIHGVKAILDLNSNQNLSWYDQGGEMDWGSQTTFPSGEVSTFPNVHSEHGIFWKLPLEGEIAFFGPVIVSGGTRSFELEDQERIYQDLNKVEQYPVIATVEQGIITRLTSKHSEAHNIISVLEALFERDVRYRTVWELGIGINTELKLWPGNTPMNEAYGGNKGVVHWGFGLPPFTEYHIDFLCPEINVYTDSGEHIFVEEYTVI
jgi:hypothetical protein